MGRVTQSSTDTLTVGGILCWFTFMDGLWKGRVAQYLNISLITLTFMYDKRLSMAPLDYTPVSG